jgi:hypothetical protein
VAAFGGLLGNQISPKSEDFCIWWPFCTLVTMATAAILNCFNPPKAATHYGGYSYKFDERNPNFSTMSRCADYFRNFQNGHHCHGNGQNAKKLKNSKNFDGNASN